MKERKRAKEKMVRGVERKESKNKAEAGKTGIQRVSGLTPGFLLSPELLVIGSRTQHHE